MPDQKAASGPPMVTMAIDVRPARMLRVKPWVRPGGPQHLVEQHREQELHRVDVEQHQEQQHPVRKVSGTSRETASRVTAKANTASDSPSSREISPPRQRKPRSAPKPCSTSRLRIPTSALTAARPGTRGLGGQRADQHDTQQAELEDGRGGQAEGDGGQGEGGRDGPEAARADPQGAAEADAPARKTATPPARSRAWAASRGSKAWPMACLSPAARTMIPSRTGRCQ